MPIWGFLPFSRVVYPEDTLPFLSLNLHAQEVASPWGLHSVNILMLTGVAHQEMASPRCCWIFIFREAVWYLPNHPLTFLVGGGAEPCPAPILPSYDTCNTAYSFRPLLNPWQWLIYLLSSYCFLACWFSKVKFWRLKLISSFCTQKEMALRMLSKYYFLRIYSKLSYTTTINLSYCYFIIYFCFLFVIRCCHFLFQRAKHSFGVAISFKNIEGVCIGQIANSEGMLSE